MTALPISRSRCRDWGVAPITLAGSAAQQRPLAAARSLVAKPSRHLRCPNPAPVPTPRRWPCARGATGDAWVLDGCKTWISNGGIADFYCVFARTGDEAGARGISAFVVPADTPGLIVAERIDVISPHPLARLEFKDCRLPHDALLGVAGEGFKLAMRTLDIFRASVAAAALGFARRALDESVAHARSRRMFGATLADLQLTQAKLGDMAVEIDAAALLTYRAAWLRDVGRARTTKEAAMAKLSATESAQRVIDAAVQLHGGLGVTHGHIVERLYRDIRALRIYEGATEVQKLIIGRELLKETST